MAISKMLALGLGNYRNYGIMVGGLKHFPLRSITKTQEYKELGSNDQIQATRNGWAKFNGRHELNKTKKKK